MLRQALVVGVVMLLGIRTTLSGVVSYMLGASDSAAKGVDSCGFEVTKIEQSNLQCGRSGSVENDG